MPATDDPAKGQPSMRNTVRLLDVLDRAEAGPIVEESQWDMFMVPMEVSRLQMELDINLGRLGDTLVPADDALADRVFEAGLTLAETLGVYCVSTSRQVKFTRAEILAALAIAPTEVTFGEGPDCHTERKRRVEDSA